MVVCGGVIVLFENSIVCQCTFGSHPCNGDRYRNKDTCNDDERDVVIRPASVPWLVNNMMVVVNCCVGGHCYFFPVMG
ncbi:hypothetical protein FRC0028_00001 [Corynebacterium diphtheriae]|nr:hypothetical protein FRC0028_00001 [Corynebacterium diphtheriae]